MATFRLPDPYEGKTLAEMKKRCRELVRAVSQWEEIAITLAIKHGVDGLSKTYAAKVKDMIAAYED